MEKFIKQSATIIAKKNMSYPKQVYNNSQIDQIITDLRQTFGLKSQEMFFLDAFDLVIEKITELENKIDELRIEMYDLYKKQNEFSLSALMLDFGLSVLLPVAGSFFGKMMARNVTKSIIGNKEVGEKILQIDWSNPNKGLGEITILSGKDMFGQSVKIIDSAWLKLKDADAAMELLQKCIKDDNVRKETLENMVTHIQNPLEKITEKNIEFTGRFATKYVNIVKEKGMENNFNNSFAWSFSQYKDLFVNLKKSFNDWVVIQEYQLKRFINGSNEELEVITQYEHLRLLAKGDYEKEMTEFFARVFKCFKLNLLLTGTTLYKSIWTQWKGVINDDMYAFRRYQMNNLSLLSQFKIYFPYTEVVGEFNKTLSLGVFDFGEKGGWTYPKKEGIFSETNLYTVYVHCVAGYIQEFGTNRVFLFLELEEGGVPTRAVKYTGGRDILFFPEKQPEIRRTIGYYLLHEIKEYLDESNSPGKDIPPFMDDAKYKEQALKQSEAHFRSRTGRRTTDGESTLSFGIPNIPKSQIINTIIVNEPIDALK